MSTGPLKTSIRINPRLRDGFESICATHGSQRRVLEAGLFALSQMSPLDRVNAFERFADFEKNPTAVMK